MSSWVSAANLAFMQRSIGFTLPDTCTILELTTTVSASGHALETWGTVAASVACRLDSPESRNRWTEIDGAWQDAERYILTIPASQALVANNRIVHNGVTYAVTQVDNDKSLKVSHKSWVEKIQ